MKVKKLNIEKMIVCMFLTINFYFAILIFNTKKYYSEFKNMEFLLNNKIFFIILFFNILSFILAYFLYEKIRIKEPLKKYNLILNKNRLNYFFLFITIIEIIFYLKTGIGKAASYKRNKISFIFNLLNLDPFFIFYYILSRSKKIIYKVNIILYVVFFILRGWTGIIFTVFLLEGFYFFSKKNIKNRYIVFIFPILLLGSKIYQYLYMLKMKIRLGVVLKINYFTGAEYLFERLSIINHSFMSVQNSEIIKKLYLEQGINYLEIKSFFRTFLPNFLFKDKYFRCLGNLLMQSVYPDISKNTSAGLGLPSYIYNIFNLGIKEFTLWFIFFIVIFYLYLKLVMFFIKISSNRKLKIIIFLWLVDLCNSGSLEMNNYGWFRIYFLIGLFFIFKIIVMKKQVKRLK